MKLTLLEVKNKFEEVIEGSLTRESADRWAYSIIQKHEANKIDFFPSEDRGKIWKGIMYLYGIDLRESPDQYLHTVDDIKTAFHKIMNDEIS